MHHPLFLFACFHEKTCASLNFINFKTRGLWCMFVVVYNLSTFLNKTSAFQCVLIFFLSNYAYLLFSRLARHLITRVWSRSVFSSCDTHENIILGLGLELDSSDIQINGLSLSEHPNDLLVSSDSHAWCI